MGALKKIISLAPDYSPKRDRCRMLSHRIVITDRSISNDYLIFGIVDGDHFAKAPVIRVFSF